VRWYLLPSNVGNQRRAAREACGCDMWFSKMPNALFGDLHFMIQSPDPGPWDIVFPTPGH